MAEWREVPGFPEYLVSDEGAVLSSPRKGTPGGVLAPWVGRKGYLKVTLNCHGARRNAAVAHLVLEAFVGPRPPGQEARHLDGNPLRNVLENLAWGPKSENAYDSIRHGTHVQSVDPWQRRGARA